MSLTLHPRPRRFAPHRRATPDYTHGSAHASIPRAPAQLNLPLWQHYPIPLMAAFLAGVLLALAGHSPLPAALVPALTAAWIHRSRKSAFHRAATAQRAAVVALCAALRAELDGGALPHGALLEAVWCRPELHDLATQINDPARATGPRPGTFGSTTADLIASAALKAPGRSGLSGLAACWRATEEYGLPLAGAVAGIEGALRAEEQRQLVLDAELSGIRTTMGLLAVLPVFGLLLGSSLGIRPWQILLQTFGGQVCLILGCTLELIGLWWADRLVATVTDLALPRRHWRTRLRDHWPSRACCSAKAGVGF